MTLDAHRRPARTLPRAGPSGVVPTLRAALSTLLPALPLRGVASIRPAPPAGRCPAVRVALRFAPGAGEEAERRAVRELVVGLREALVAGVAADGTGPDGVRWVRVVGAG